MTDYFLKAKKSLGQHFLRSEKALNLLVESVDGESKVVFEIGPGEGVLTEKLLEKKLTVFTIEIDKRSIEILQEKFKTEIENKKLFIIERDCLEVDYSKILLEKNFSEEYFLIGNIPYYITGAIFRHTFEQKVLPKEATFLIQKEVAQRIVAHDKKESLLSVSVKIFSNYVKILDIVKAGSFVPPPKVDSAIISIKNILNPFETAEKQEVFFKILKAAFSHKRKFLLSNLKKELETNLQQIYLESIKIKILESYSEKVRAEDIDISFWKKIIEII